MLKVENMSDTLNFIDFELNGIKYAIFKIELAKAFLEMLRMVNNERNTNFSRKLLELICKADENNKLKLAKAYPEFVCAYLCWYHKEFMGVKYTDPDGDDDRLEMKFFNSVLKRLKGEE